MGDPGRRGRLAWLSIVLAAVGGTMAACNALWGIDELQYDLATPAGVAAFGGAAGAGGAGGAAGAGGNGDPCTVEVVPACAQYAAAYCGRLDACAPFWVRYHWSSVVDCAARHGADCTRRLAALGTATTAAHMASCADALLVTGCDDLLSNQLPLACGGPPGPLILGASCDTGGQCETGFCTGEDDPESCGVCSPVPEEGSSCSTQCGAGLRCVNGLCRQLAFLGDACEDLVTPCLQLYDCHNDVCTQPLGEGSTCDPAGQTTPACDIANGLKCDAGTSECQEISWAPPGDACGLASLVLCDHGWCLDGTCVARVADCQPCDDETGPVCQALATCANGSCQPRLYQGCFGQ